MGAVVVAVAASEGSVSLAAGAVMPPRRHHPTAWRPGTNVSAGLVHTRFGGAKVARAGLPRLQRGMLTGKVSYAKWKETVPMQVQCRGWSSNVQRRNECSTCSTRRNDGWCQVPSTKRFGASGQTRGREADRAIAEYGAIRDRPTVTFGKPRRTRDHVPQNCAVATEGAPDAVEMIRYAVHELIHRSLVS